VGLLDASEEPKSQLLRYSVTGVAFVILVSFGIWYGWFLFFFEPERRTVEHFMNAVVSGDLPQGYKIWKPHGTSYSFDEFKADWGVSGYYSPLKSYRIETAEQPRDGSGVIVVVEISPFEPFPPNSDPRSGRNREVSIWVERSDQSLSFPP
jgi:hypothetical protein